MNNMTEYIREYLRDPKVRVWRNVNIRINEVLKKYGIKKTMKEKRELIGCNKEEFIAWIESTFEEGMEWRCYGMGHWRSWEIDHKVAFHEFSLTRDEDQRKAFNYTNMRALFRKDNRGRAKRGKSYQGTGRIKPPDIINFK